MNEPTIDDGGPAFPVPPESFGPSGEMARPFYGLSLRDWFAGMAMQGIQASCTNSFIDATLVAEKSYEQADVMLEARKKHLTP